MAITTVLAYVVARQVFKWNKFVAGSLTAVFVRRPGLLRRQRAEDPARRVGAARDRGGDLHAAVDVEDGPRHARRAAARARVSVRAVPQGSHARPPISVPGRPSSRPAAARRAADAPHNLQHNKVLHARGAADERPRTCRTSRPSAASPSSRSARILPPDPALRVHGGAERARRGQRGARRGLPIDKDDITCFLRPRNAARHESPGMAPWRERLFARDVAQRHARDGVLQNPARARRRNRHAGRALG